MIEENVHTYFIGVTEGKIEKRRQNEDKHLNFRLHNTLCLPKDVHKILKHWHHIEAKKSVIEIPLERKKKEKIQGLISKMWLFSLRNTTHHFQALYQISES